MQLNRIDIGLKRAMESKGPDLEAVVELTVRANERLWQSIGS